MTPDEIFAHRVRLTVQEVELGRVEHDRESVSTLVGRFFTVDKSEHRRIVEAAMERLGDPPEKEVVTKMSEPKNVLRGKELRAAAAEIFSERPEMTASEVYDALLARGHRIAMKRSSFAAEATTARKIAAGEVESDAKAPAPPKSSGGPKRPPTVIPPSASTSAPQPAGNGSAVPLAPVEDDKPIEAPEPDPEPVAVAPPGQAEADVEPLSAPQDGHVMIGTPAGVLHARRIADGEDGHPFYEVLRFEAKRVDKHTLGGLALDIMEEILEPVGL